MSFIAALDRGKNFQKNYIVTFVISHFAMCSYRMEKKLKQ